MVLELDLNRKCEECRLEAIIKRLNNYVVECKATEGKDTKITVCCVCKGIKAGNKFIHIETILKELFQCLCVNHSICSSCAKEIYHYASVEKHEKKDIEHMNIFDR